MNSITQISAHFFLFALAFATQILSPVVDTRLTGVGFYKLATTIVLACLVFAVGIDYFMLPGLETIEFVAYMLLIGLNVLSYLLHGDKKTPLLWFIYSLQSGLFVVLSFYIFKFNINWITFFTHSMALIGISNFAMILGHYYLVVPKLSEEPLIYCLNIFWVIIFLKLMLSIPNLIMSYDDYLLEGAIRGDGYLYNWLFISMRYLWGYLAPLVLSFFTYRLCRMRSIQSATGVLYILEFFVIVGELISIYLMSKHGLIL
jgi:hypothetical protein